MTGILAGIQPPASLASRGLAAARALRKQVCQNSLAAFLRLYLPHYCAQPFSPMHQELFTMLEPMARQRNQRVAIAAPRGHAKSTIVSLAFVLWLLAYQRESFILIISATGELAEQLLRNIRDELELNDQLRLDFPHLCPPTAGKGKPAPWRGGALRTPCGASVRGLGMEQQIRGLRNRQSRPGLILIDDAETPEGTLSQEGRAKLADIFTRTLLKAGDLRTNVVVIGTILHQDSLLAQLVDPDRSPGWNSRRYRALVVPPTNKDLWRHWEGIYSGKDRFSGETGPGPARAYYESHRSGMDEGAQVLWPEQDPLYQLKEMQLREGVRSFQSEKQNEPLDPALCLFSSEHLSYWTDQYPDVAALRSALGHRLIFYMSWDPSLGSSGTNGDFSAIVVIAKDSHTETRYVVEADLSRCGPALAIGKILDLWVRYAPAYIAVESNGFQTLLVGQLQDAAQPANVRLRILPIQHTGNKVARIQLLEPLAAQARIQFSRAHTELMDQFRNFPHGSFDDGPDAVELAYECSKYRPR